MKDTGSNRRIKLNELEDLHNEAYKSSWIYKAPTKTYHDKYISQKIFEPNQ